MNNSDAGVCRKIGPAPQNLSHKLVKDNFIEKELADMIHCLGCSLDISFILGES
ncbi:MAG: transcriptional regulator [Candidatus Humimicrobiaceae bacterium]